MCSIEQLRFPISPIVKVSVSLPLGVCVCLLDWVVAILTTIQERSLATQQHLLLQVQNPTFHPRSSMKFYPLLETRSNIVRRTKSEPSLDYSLLPPDKTYSVQHVLPQWVLLLSPAASAQGNREFPQTHTHTLTDILACHRIWDIPLLVFGGGCSTEQDYTAPHHRLHKLSLCREANDFRRV